jgi:predicted dinucleotide-binding enzyme
MHDIKTIGIIGAGFIGGTLARRWRKLGLGVAIANSRGPETLRDLAAETGAKAVTARDAVKGVDLVVVTIPQKSVPLLPKDLFAGVPKEVVVIDTNNYYPARDGRIDAIENGAIESVWVSEQLGRPVIKAFNNIGYKSLLEKGAPRGTPGRVALPIAGDDASAKARVLGLVERLGFDAVDAGSLADSWRQQPGTPVYTRDFDLGRVKAALTEADRAKIAAYRHEANESIKAYFAS